MSTRTRHKLRTVGLLLSIGMLSVFAYRATRAPDLSWSATHVVSLPGGLPVEREAIRFEPPGHVRAARLDRTGVLFVETDGTPVSVNLPGVCPVLLPRDASPEPVQARPLLDFGSEWLTQLGYDAPVEIVVRPGCESARGATVRWSQVEGPPLDSLQVSDNGLRLRARTLPMSAFFAAPLPPGIVAVSPRTQGRYVLEATARAAGAPPVRKRITLTSIARATGLGSVSVSQRLLLGTPGLRVRAAPRGSRAQVVATMGQDSFEPDVMGHYQLADASGRVLEVQALTHEHTPYDCGRSECHQAEANTTLSTPMSHALQRVSDARGLSTCAIACHAVGEPGLRDGGFIDVAQGMHFRALTHTPFNALPHALQRLGGVRCTSCHGPGAIPTATGRARILRADVCATCHDAPPAYAHVAQWSESRMARSDADRRTRENPRCARCHTTGGFLDAMGVRERADRSRDPDERSVGIACAACHAPHGDHLKKGLVRKTGMAASVRADALEETASALCTQCHAPMAEEVTPSASSAALWLGRISWPTALGGGVLQGPAPHADVEGGCMACHGTQGDAPGKTHHGFAVGQDACSGCHEKAPSREASASLRTRAEALVAQLDALCGSASWGLEAPAHAVDQARRCGASQEVARARYAILLVLEDPAAHQHNPLFSADILAHATQTLDALSR